jgi:hypothetical protein
MASDAQSLYGNIAANAGHLAFLFFAYWVASPTAWVGFLAVIVAISFYGWLYSYKRKRAISDIAPSRIASAAQGYVELNGIASIGSDNLIVSPMSARQCVWFRCSVYVADNDGSRLVSRNTSEQTIQINDGTGSCQIDPDHAEISGASRRVTKDGTYTYIEELLYGGSSLYVLGEFSTIGGANSVLDIKQDVAELLAEWKQNKAALLRRFDLDKNGEIDMHEWESARHQALREVQQQHRELRLQSGVNVVGAPSDDRLFLISTLSPQKLRAKFAFWSVFHLIVVFAASASALAVWQRHHLHTLFS